MKFVASNTLLELRNKLSNVKDSCTFICPYIQSEFTNQLIDLLPSEVKIRVVTRYTEKERVDGIINYEFAAPLSKHFKHFELRIVKDLHAKLYLFDYTSAFITSANLTHHGLSLNVEYGMLIDDAEMLGDIKTEVDRLWTNAVDYREFFKNLEIKDELVQAYKSTSAGEFKRQIENIVPPKPLTDHEKFAQSIPKEFGENIQYGQKVNIFHDSYGFLACKIKGFAKYHIVDNQMPIGIRWDYYSLGGNTSQPLLLNNQFYTETKYKHGWRTFRNKIENLLWGYPGRYEACKNFFGMATEQIPLKQIFMPDLAMIITDSKLRLCVLPKNVATNNQDAILPLEVDKIGDLSVNNLTQDQIISTLTSAGFSGDNIHFTAVDRDNKPEVLSIPVGTGPFKCALYIYSTLHTGSVVMNPIPQLKPMRFVVLEPVNDQGKEIVLGKETFKRVLDSA